MFHPRVAARVSALISLAFLASCRDTPAEPSSASDALRAAGSREGIWVGYAVAGPRRTGWIRDQNGDPIQVIYEVQEGRAIWNGDIDIGPAAQIPSSREALMRVPSDARFSMMLYGSDNRWPNGRVPYEISTTLPDSARVLSGIATLIRETNGIVLVPRTDEDDFIRFVPATGCSSRLGRVGGLQEIKLAPDCDAGSVQHEVLHAIGFLHEHQRCDREYYIEILLQNVESGFERNFEPRCGTGSDEGFDFGEYDELSIMHYAIRVFSANGQRTISSLRGRDALMGSRVVSAGDKAGVDYLYGAFNDTPTLVFSLPEGTQFEGAAVNFDAAGSFDPDDPGFEYIWNFGDGTCDGPPPKPLECSLPNPKHIYAQNGKYTGRVAVTDRYSVARTSFVLVVENQQPTGSIVGPSSILEGQYAQFEVKVDDAGRDDISIELDPGTGAAAQTGFVPLSEALYDNPMVVRSRRFYITFPESGTIVVTAYITDSDGAAKVVRRLVTVLNSAPTVTIASMRPVYTSGETIPFSLSINDTGANDGPWRYAWDVGFQSSVAGSVAALGVHTFPLQACTPGVWPTTLVVTDKDGASTTASRSVTVVASSIAIDVLPGGTPNTISLSRSGRLSTAVLGSMSVDVSTLDVGTLELGNGLAIDTRVGRRKDGSPYATIEDVNGDGILDLLLMFDLDALRLNGDLTATTTSLAVRGKRRDGCTNVHGVDAVRMVR